MAVKSRWLGVVFALGASPLLANQPPGPQTLLGAVAILPAMVILTAIGGGYAVLRRISPKRHLVWKTIAVIVAIVFAMVNVANALLILLLFAIVALVRAGRLITWGVRERRPRLALSGVALIAVVFVLAWMSSAFAGAYEIGDEYRVAELRKYIALRLALRTAPESQRAGLEAKLAQQLGYFNDERGKFQLVENGDHFAAYLLPSTRRFPPTPWNRFYSAPAWRGDDTGAIRKAYVHERIRCPDDAPIVDRVKAGDYSLEP